jgi:NAD(P)-dependent dehydrogenase (short-subunit alcohol dehydrogenase family)
MSDRTAVVTGGSGGIGVACAKVLVARGYDVVLTARTEQKLRAAAEQLGARHVAADAGDEAEFTRVADAVERVDMLVHAAGVLKGTYVRKERLEDFDEVMRTNMRSAVVVTQALLPKIPVGGRIIFVSSSGAPDGLKTGPA